MSNPVWEILVDLIRGVYGIMTNIIAFAVLVVPLTIMVTVIILIKLLPILILGSMGLMF